MRPILVLLGPLLIGAAARADDLPPVADAQVYSGSATTNYGTSPNLFLSASCCPRRFYRAYLRFNLSAYPSGTQVARADVYWYQWGGGGAGCLPANLHRVTGAWSEGTITWARKPPHNSHVESTRCVGDNFKPGWKTWAVTAVVNGWLSGAFANYGVTIKDPTEGSAGAGRVGRGYSREHTNPARRPFLRLRFATLAATGTPRTGTTVNLALFAPMDAKNGYVCGSAFGSTPGIPVDTRVIPVNADALLFLSLTTPAIFAGYAGRLDGAGKGAAAIHIPAATPLVGVAFYTTFVTLRAGAPSGIGAIADAVALKIVS